MTKKDSKEIVLSDYGKAILENLRIDKKNSEQILRKFKSGKLSKDLDQL